MLEFDVSYSINYIDHKHNCLHLQISTSNHRNNREFVMKIGMKYKIHGQIPNCSDAWECIMTPTLFLGVVTNLHKPLSLVMPRGVAA